MEKMKAAMRQQVPEGHAWLAGGLRSFDPDPVLVTGTWDSSSKRPAGSTQATTRSTIAEGNQSSPSWPVGRRSRPSTAKRIGFQAFGRDAR
ncbi:hypothetical protein AGOR_G00214880 [Albula goreensis]|uniref:Uncharacterized protein n=1 Tax=Albula goreensis TaxID=1534307 RepID=A0A8T3CN07_9TELE|nr:hypothetical protein AGOR_G00214880 [Albula goreensis]